MKIRNKFFLFLIVATTIYSTSQAQEGDIEDKSNEFDVLIKELVPNPSKLEDGIYYISNTNSCQACVMSNIFMLQELPSGLDHFVPILLGESGEINVQSLFDDVVQVKFDNSLYIKDFSTEEYGLDVSKSLLLHFKDGELSYSSTYNDFELQEAEKYILANLE